MAMAPARPGLPRARTADARPPCFSAAPQEAGASELQATVARLEGELCSRIDGLEQELEGVRQARRAAPLPRIGPRSPAIARR